MDTPQVDTADALRRTVMSLISEKYKGAASEEKVSLLEQDIDLLWRKVCVYEEYAAEKQKSPNKSS